MTTTSTLPPTNTEWGFYGTVAHSSDAAAAWPIAFWAICETTGCDGETAREFLDSRYGRHFADDVVNALATHTLADAIAATTARWMGWRISVRTSRETGIPRGLPYLTGFVLHAGIEAELAAA